MDKAHLLDYLLKDLEVLLETLVQSAVEAKESATHEESKAENKYDTRGLEASYLAGAQAERAAELKRSISQLQKLKEALDRTPKSIQLTSIVKVFVDGEDEKCFFLLPCAGGYRIPVGQLEVITLTPQSPVGRALVGKSIGEIAEVRKANGASEYEIIEIH